MGDYRRLSKISNHRVIGMTGKIPDNSLILLISSFIFCCSVVKQAHQPFIKSFGLQENDIAFIGSQINLTCKMKNAQVSIFLKSGVTVTEGGRYKYIHVHSAHKRLDSYLEITNVTKDDEGNYTCFAYTNGILTSAKYTLKTGLWLWFQLSRHLQLLSGTLRV